MAQPVDVAILGSGFRGLWLATELVKLGWSVSWFQVHTPQSPKREGGFVFDDWPWQVGPNIQKSNFINATQGFVEDVIRPKTQKLSVQILTLQGPLELSGPAASRTLKKFFPKVWDEIQSYLESVSKSQNINYRDGGKLLSQHTKKFFQRPSGERWPIEWLGSLRRSRAVPTVDWVRKWDGDLLDPSAEFWLLEDSLTDVVERAMTWAERLGVKVRRKALVSDIGIEGRVATGIEIKDGQGFQECKRILLACSYQSALKAVPRFISHITPQVKPQSETWVWARCGFYLKPHSKPEGLADFSSFVMDYYMPLTQGNMGLLRWKTSSTGDSLTVWTRIPFDELRRRSFLMSLTEELETHLEKLFPWFTKCLLASFPFEEYFHSPEASHDDLAIVFDGKNKFRPGKSRLKNVHIMGPASDRGLELLSQLATEYRMYGLLNVIRDKELKRDRALHPTRNG